MVVVRFIVICTNAIQLVVAYHRRKNTPEGRQAFSVYLRAKLERLGPTFIKIGQILSLRPDLVPVEICMELRNLLDKSPEITTTEVLAIVQDELGVEPTAVFSHISKQPIGSASIAQVHKAQLREGGEYVVIKVRKPGVKKMFKSDIKVLRLITFIFRHQIDRAINSKYVLDELASVFEKETNFTTEAANIERFKEAFKNVRFVKTPKVYWDYTTQKVLVMEFIAGISLNKVFNKMDKEPKLKDQETFFMEGMEINKKKITKRLVQVTAQSLFDDGFFHADPHPANMILTYDDKICFIDFGMVGDLLTNEKVLFREFVYYLAIKDETKMLDMLMEYNKSVGMRVPSITQIPTVKHYLHELINNYSSSDQNTFPITSLMYSLGSMAFKFHSPPPPFIMLISKQIFTLEGFALYLKPDLNVLEEFKPFVYTYKTKDSIKNLNNTKLLKFFDDSMNLGLSLPESINSIVSKLKEEGLQPIAQAHQQNMKPIFIILALYLVLLGVISFNLTNQSELLFIIWSSIITAILILYFILYQRHND
jgi:ubiquinone biosynthesis protein